ncbi:MAG: hypothetical protein PHV32_13425 [Eubacteriales bacterium]|nr:hypothetical protein [Eubacteriales bacterium]
METIGNYKYIVDMLKVKVIENIGCGERVAAVFTYGGYGLMADTVPDLTEEQFKEFQANVIQLLGLKDK